MLYVGEVFMEMNDYVTILQKLHNQISNDVMSHPSCTEEDLVILRDSLSSLITQLEFWMKQDNHQRYIYELENHTKWLANYFK